MPPDGALPSASLNDSRLGDPRPRPHGHVHDAAASQSKVI